MKTLYFMLELLAMQEGKDTPLTIGMLQELVKGIVLAEQEGEGE